MSNADKYLSVFNKIEKHLQHLSNAKAYEDFTVLLGRLSGSSGVIRAYKNDLREYAELRNAIVHQSTGEAIAEPHNDTVENLQKIYDILKKPPTVYDIASKPVYTCKIGDNIVDVVKIMAKEVYTHVPIYDGDKFEGVFSESAITRWFGDFAAIDGFLSEKTQIGELKKYFDKTEDAFSCYKFASKNTDVFTMLDDFLSFVNDKKRLGAVFVTESGKKDDKVIGVITSWDLPKIKKWET